MSSANTDLGLGQGQPANSTAASTVAAPLRTLAGVGLRTVRAVAFWAAVALPFASVALLFGGPLGAADLGAFAGLAGANLLALVVGHGHGHSAGGADAAGVADPADAADTVDANTAGTAAASGVATDGGVEVTGEPGTPDVSVRERA